MTTNAVLVEKEETQKQSNNLPDSIDFKLLSIAAGLINQTPDGKISSWSICKAMYPQIANPQNHLSSVIWRITKLCRLNYMLQHPHPSRKDKKVYSLTQLAFSIDGTVFIPSPFGGIIVNCTYASPNGCNPCKFGSKDCKLSTSIINQGLEPVLKIVEHLTKKMENEAKEKKTK